MQVPNILNVDVGPWNDGSVPGYPQADKEKFMTKYGIKH